MKEYILKVYTGARARVFSVFQNLQGIHYHYLSENQQKMLDQISGVGVEGVEGGGGGGVREQ